MQVISSRTVYENKWMALREDKLVRQDGTPGLYAVVEKPDFATIAAFERGGFWLIQQDRYPTGIRSWEFPQGTHDSDNPEEVARTELRQETGISAERMQYVATVYNAPGLTSQACHVFLASGLTPGATELDPEEQDLIHQWFSLEEIEAMIADGRMVETVSMATVTLLRAHRLIS
jgi:8-oxo-dGTP pyrophosphatase MutT (NUDIX family)